MTYELTNLDGIQPGQFSLSQLEQALEAQQTTQLGLSVEQARELLAVHVYHHSIEKALEAGRLDDARQFLKSAAKERALDTILTLERCSDEVREFARAKCDKWIQRVEAPQ